VPLSSEDLSRYARHIALGGIGMEGQERINKARVLVAGLGGLGSAASMYLAAAGVGVLGLADFDSVERGNLQRQILHGTEWVGKPKVDSALSRLHSINPDVKLEAFREKVTARNGGEIIRGFDIIVGAFDSIGAKHALNEACQKAGKPMVHGSLDGWKGEVACFVPGGGPCYRCLYQPGVESGSSGGVFGPLAGIIGAVTAGECLKLLTGAGTSLVGRLLRIDARDLRFSEFILERDPDCACCGNARGK